MATTIHGHCDPRFKGAMEAMAQNLDSGDDLGASFAVTLRGELIVDLWGGYLDQERSVPWQQDTIVNVFSTTKTMCFLCCLLLVDRGQLELDAPVSTYWPEFAANGKAGVKVWHLLDHAAGLSGLDIAVAQEELCDWDRITTLLAEQKPWWTPGSATAYHAITQGFLLGELVRRISGQSLGQFFRQEIAEPLNADFHIGVPESEFSRIGNLIPATEDTRLVMPGDPDSIQARTFASPTIRADFSWTPEWRRAEIPAVNGHGNARSIARIHAPLACDGSAGGQRLVSTRTTELLMQSRISGVDMALGLPVSFGTGFALRTDELPIVPSRKACFWGGWGGSLVIIDQQHQMTIAYAMNRMAAALLGDNRSMRLLQAVYAALS